MERLHTFSTSAIPSGCCSANRRASDMSSQDAAKVASGDRSGLGDPGWSTGSRFQSGRHLLESNSNQPDRGQAGPPQPNPAMPSRMPEARGAESAATSLTLAAVERIYRQQARVLVPRLHPVLHGVKVVG
jgi:hypothetical protein